MTEESIEGRPLIYLAASLFTPFDRERNLRIARALEATGFRVFLPQTIPAPMVGGELDLRPVYEGCVAGLKHVSAVLAVVDGAEVDAGVAWELGYAAALDVPTLCVRTDLRRSEYRGVNIMIEFGATQMAYATGYRGDAEDVLQRIATEVRGLLERQH